MWYSCARASLRGRRKTPSPCDARTVGKLGGGCAAYVQWVHDGAHAHAMHTNMLTHMHKHMHTHIRLRSPWKRASRSDQSHASIASSNTPGSASTQVGCIAVSVRYAAGMPELPVAGPSRRPGQACPSRPEARDVKRAAASSSAGARRCSAPWDMIRPASWCVTAASDGHNREASCRASGRRVSTVHRMGMRERRTTARPTRCRVALARGREALAAREGAGREGAGRGYLQQPHTLGSLRQGSQCDICERVLRLQVDSASSRFPCSLE